MLNMQRITLAEILTDHVMTLSPNTPIQQALDVMVGHYLSSLIVVDADNRPIGIFTERDSLKVISGEISSTALLSEVSSTPPFSAHIEDEIHDAYLAMSEKGYRHLVVVDDDGRLMGVVTQGDFLRHIGFDDLNRNKQVSDVMTKTIVMLSSTVTIGYAAEKMAESHSSYAIIVDEMDPIGLVTERDILRYASSDNTLSDDPVSRIYQTSFPIIREDHSLSDAAALMEQHGVHQVVIADREQKIVGLLTRYDLLQALHGSHFEFLIRQINIKSTSLSELKNVYIKLQKDKDLLAKSEAKFHTLFELLQDGIVLIDIQTLLAVEFNTAAAQQLGYTREAFATMRINDYDAIEASNETLQRIRTIVETGSRTEFETRHRHKNGSLLNIAVSASAFVLDEKSYLFAQFRDITADKKREEQLEFVANYDALTGLANRSLLKKQLERSIDKAGWQQTKLALIIFDIDRFKDVNDSFGHSAGDALLIQISERFNQIVQKKYLISRMGGDEFCVVIETLDRPEYAAILTDELIQILAEAFRLENGIDVHIGASAGIAIFPEHGTSPELLIQHADAALYRAKNEGKNTYRYYTDDLTARSQHRINMEAKLRFAINHGELRVFYQPQVQIATGRIIGAEALVRWLHPSEGMIFPDAFIPLAEESGLINFIGEFVLRETCRQGKQWLDAGHHLTLAVNLSSYQFQYQNIQQLVESALAQSHYPANRLELEITESALMQREEASVVLLHALRAMGVRLAIDDFGTGYSSLSYLKRFPLDVLKIDKSFIDEVTFNKDDVAIVKTIIAMAKALNFSVLAEGVERIDQLDFLREQGCDLYQGYYKSRPVSADVFEKLLRE